MYEEGIMYSFFLNIDFAFVNTLQKNFLTFTIQNRCWPSFYIYVLYVCQCFITQVKQK